MIGVSRRPSGFPNFSRLPSTPSTPKVGRVSGKSPNASGDPGASEAASASQSLSNNPSLRALRGESGFDGVFTPDPQTTPQHKGCSQCHAPED